MNSALYNALNEANVVIPFPQRDLNVVSNVKVERVNGCPGMHTNGPIPFETMIEFSA